MIQFYTDKKISDKQLWILEKGDMYSYKRKGGSPITWEVITEPDEQGFVNIKLISKGWSNYDIGLITRTWKYYEGVNTLDTDL
jgi:hypothetical protein